MKVVILAGGLGTRISEESHLKPKPMIEISDRPILWHIMKIYSHYGYNDFIICAGYKQNVIKEYFANYYLHCTDITFDLKNNNAITVHNNTSEPWTVTVVDTGLNTMTGGRIKRIKNYIGNETFMLTYGDGVADINLDKLLEAHKKGGRAATITAVQPGVRFGTLDISDEGNVKRFTEKPIENSDWVNAGYMVLEPSVFDYIENDQTIFERAPLENLVAGSQLNAYRHHGFWRCMDTMRDKEVLENLILEGKAPWMVW